MPFLATGAILTHYDLTGPQDAPVLLLANSIGTSFHVWDAMVPELARCFRVLRYDMRGHGLSDAPPVPVGAPGYSMDLLAGDAEALLDGLGIARAHVCGLSIGGMVAQRLAARAPERVERLVLCDTAPVIGPAALWDERVAVIRGGGLAGMAPGVMTRWFTAEFRAARPDVVRGYVNMVARTPIDGYVGCALALRDADLRAGAATIRAPTLVVVGDQDAATPLADAEWLAATIPEATLSVIANAAHIPCVEQPEAFTRLLLAFLDEASPVA